MLAIDTNLIVRYLIGDHPRQSTQARAIIDGEAVFVGKAVLLEAEWVLRSAYDFAAPHLVQVLRAFAGLPTVVMENPLEVAQALDWMEAGMDFADALHLASAHGCDGFVTFDQKFARLARRLDVTKVRSP